MTRQISIGGKGLTKKILIGGGAPVSLQTMWKESIKEMDEEQLESIVKRLDNMQQMGCDIVRFAVPDFESAANLCKISKKTSVPLVADIHFNYRLALACLEGNIAAIRINPGNIGSFENTKAVVDACREKKVAIRIGINSGSLLKDLQTEVAAGKISRSEAICETAVREIEVFEKLDFHNVVVSMKSSSVEETVEANRFFAKKYDYPLHLGVTEAGPLIGGVVKSTIAFSRLLSEGIGDTIRVSLSSEMENEVIAGREILHECGKRDGGITLVSCPRCGRMGFDVHGFVARWQSELLKLNATLTVAVMGCVVNGPGEGKHADIGIAGASDNVIIFKKGEIVRTIPAKDADNAFREELQKLL